jgi:peptidoglycan/LPS O-acetylase OafA/YrhL
MADLTRTHYVQLDGLRGLAILMVMAYHFCLPHPDFHSRDSGFLLQLAQGGWMGVDLFFVLSGFLITGILMETRTQQHYFRNFLGRRFLRIWPLYYLSLLALLVAFPAVLREVPAQLQSMQDKQLWFWLYGANWLYAREGGFSQTSGGYFWSLAVEEQFYLLWPFVVYRLRDRGLLRASLGLLGLSLASRIVLTHLGVGSGSLYTMTFTHLDGLAVGSCLAVCLRSPELTARVMRWLPLAVGCALVGLVVVRLADRDLFFWSRHMATYGYTFIAIVFGALLVHLLGGGKALGLNRLCRGRFMRQAGKYSYALYMVHVPVASLLFPLTSRALQRWAPDVGPDLRFVVFAAVSFAVSWGLAVASWYLFEKPILSLKRYFTYEEGTTRPAVAELPRSAANTLPG